MRPVTSPNVTRKLAWTAGYISFEGETLDDAIQDINRYNQRQIIIADPSLLRVQVGGRFLATDPDSFVGVLQHTFGIQVQAANSNGDIRLTAGATKPP